MKPQYSFIAKENSAIKDELQKKYNISRREYRRIKAHGQVYINTQLQKATYPLTKGDKVEIYIVEEPNMEPQDIPLDIIYEDEYLIVINKPGNILVHPVHEERTHTIANGLLYYRNTKNENWGIHPIHRLDRETSGLVLFAKTSYIHKMMGESLEKKNINREYLAVAEGNFFKKQGEINLPILDIPVAKRVDPEGKEAITLYKVVKEYKKYSLVKLKLLTGRTHQIRIHLKAVGNPLVGDTLYNRASKLISRQALHAFRLSFDHPITKEKMTYTSKVSKDFYNLLRVL